MHAQGGREPRSKGSGGSVQPGSWSPPDHHDRHTSATDAASSRGSAGPVTSPPIVTLPADPADGTDSSGPADDQNGRDGAAGTPGAAAPDGATGTAAGTAAAPDGAAGTATGTAVATDGTVGTAVTTGVSTGADGTPGPAGTPAGDATAADGAESGTDSGGGEEGSSAGTGASAPAADGPWHVAAPAGGVAQPGDEKATVGAGAPPQWHDRPSPADPWAAPGGSGAAQPWAGSGGPGTGPDSGAAGPYSTMGGSSAPPVPAGGPAPWRSTPGADGAGLPGTPPPWGGSAPYGYGTPPRRANSGLVAALVGGAVLMVILLVIGVATAGSGDDPKKISGKAADQAGSALYGVPGLTLTGTYAGGRARFDVTRAGSARGSYTSGGAQVGRVDIAGATYLKAGSAFWTSQGVSSTRAGKAAGKWTKAPDFAVELNLSDLSPARLAQVLQGAGNDPLARRTKADGVQAIKMAAGGRTYYITATGARRLLRVEGTTDAGRYSFDVTPLASSGMGAVFSALRADVRGLVNAYDPEISVLPIGRLRFGDCAAPGCTVSVDVRPSAEEQTSATIRVSMNVSFRGTQGTVSTCSATAPTKTGRQRTLSCRTRGDAWSSWYGTQTGRFTIHAGAVFSASVNSAADVSSLLDRLSQEQHGN